jgi:hypothetical protein
MVRSAATRSKVGPLFVESGVGAERQVFESPALLAVGVLEHVPAGDHLHRHQRRGAGEIDEVYVVPDLGGQRLLHVESPAPAPRAPA